MQGLKYFWFVSFPRHIALFNDSLNLICSTSRSSPHCFCVFFTPAIAECDFNQHPDWILFDLLHQSQFSETLADRSSGLPYISHQKNTLSKWGLDGSVCFENRMCLEKNHTAIKFMCLSPWQILSCFNTCFIWILKQSPPALHLMYTAKKEISTHLTCFIFHSYIWRTNPAEMKNKYIHVMGKEIKKLITG